MPALSEPAVVILHKLLTALTRKAYEHGYADAKAKKPADPDTVKISTANIRKIKLP